MTRLRTGLAAVLAVAVAFQAAAPVLGDAAARAVSDVLITLLAGSAAVGYRRRIRHERTRRARGVMVVGTIAGTVWAAANLLFLAGGLGGSAALPIAGAVLSMLGAMLLPLGVHLLAPPEPGAERWRRLIDVAAVAGAAYAVAWVYLLDPSRTSWGGTPGAMVGTVASAPELLAAAIAVVTMSRNLPTRGGRAPRVLGAASIVLAVTSIVPLRDEVDGRSWYAGGAGGGYVLAAGLVAVACRLPTPRSEPAGTRRLVSGAWAFLPYVPILLAVGATAARQLTAGALPAVLVWVLLATFVLVLLRQFLTLAIVGRLAISLEDKQAELAYAADHDALTGLANRARFHRCGAALLAADPEHSVVLLLDLDGFKPVNDRHGHAAGDEVLRAVAARLTAAVRPGDLVARLGGDEFVLLLPDVAGAEQGRELADRIRRTIAAPIPLTAGPSVRIGASIGLATGRPGTELDALIRESDAAMYAAKPVRAR